MDIYGFTLPDIIGIGLSLISIIVASAIPKAIRKYRVQEAMTEINVALIMKLKDFRDRLGFCEDKSLELKYIDFIHNINEIITLYSFNSKYFPFENRIKIRMYNIEYKVFIFGKKPLSKIPAQKYTKLIVWIDKYCEVIKDIDFASEKSPKYITTINKTNGGKDDGECK